MNLLVCTKRDLHGALFLNQLLPRLADHRVVGVWLSDKTRDAELAVPELAALRQLERTLPVEWLFPQVDAWPADPAAAAPGAPFARYASFAGLARRHRLTVEVVDSVNGDAARAKMSALDPDLVLVARFSHIFDAQTIALPRFGMINCHPGRLPEYAGLQAPLRTVIEGGTELCCAVHWIVPGIDAGPLLALHPQPLDPAAALLDQVAALYPMAIPTLLEAAAECAAGRRPAGRPQDLARRRYRSTPGPADFAAWWQRGLPLWNERSYRALLAGFVPPARPLPDWPLPELTPHEACVPSLP